MTLPITKVRSKCYCSLQFKILFLVVIQICDDFLVNNAVLAELVKSCDERSATTTLYSKRHLKHETHHLL